MMERGLTIVIASGGGERRDCLSTIVGQVVRQMEPPDQLIVDVNRDAPWGHRARNRCMRMAKDGNGIVFYDDDDLIEPDGLSHVRKAFNEDPNRAHIFRMWYGATSLWQSREIKCGNVSTQMICVPRMMTLYSQWGDRYEGDYDFIKGVELAFGQHSIVWHPQIVAHHNGQRMR